MIWLRNPAYRRIVASGMLGLLLSAMLHLYSQRQEEARLRSHFEYLAHDRAMRMQNSLDQDLEVLTTVSSMFDASELVTRHEFQLMLLPVLKRHPEIMAINWAPRIASVQRQAFELALRAEELGTQGIINASQDADSLEKAGERPEYFPVLFSEPLANNRMSIGIDPYARPENRVAMDNAVRAGSEWSSAPFALAQAPHGPPVISIYQPVYQPNRSLSTVSKRQKALRGFVVLVLRPGFSLEAMLQHLSPVGLDTQLLDMEQQSPLVYHYPGRLPHNEISPDETLHDDYRLTLPGRNWILRISATRGFRDQAGSGEPLAVLISGLVLSSLICLFLLAHARQTLQRNQLMEELKASEQRLRQTFETNRAVKMIIDPADGRIVDANSAASAYYGYPHATLLTMRISNINILPEAVIAAEMHQADTEHRLYFNFRHRLANGEIRDVEVYSGPIETPEGQLLYSIVHDVTERKRTELALQESEIRFRQLTDNLEAVFWINTPDWRQVTYISPAYERIWGRSIESLYQHGMDWFEAVLEEDRPAILALLPKESGADWQTIEFPPYRIFRPDGGIRWILARAYPIRDAQGRITRVAGIAEDISDRQTYQQHLEELAHYDPLTHLPNRRLLADRLRLSLARSQRSGQLLAICMLDLDGFKPVNDKFGHEVGDQFLIQVSQRLLDTVRRDDTVARLGGDEFVVLLGGLNNTKEMEEALSRLLHSVAAPYAIADQPVSISASIGVTLYPDDRSDADTLLRHADHAMYLAKQAGKNRYHQFNPVLEKRERDNRAALSQIRKAVEENQLRLFYQPIVDCRRGLVVSMEALLRWEHPLLGLMGPAEFLPLVESDDDLARSVGTWVLRHAIEQADLWRQAGFDLPVNVNVFVQQLRDPALPELLRNLLAEHPDLPASQLCIEILENTALDDFTSVSGLIRICSSQGIRFALDDFGTGFSSLTYLRRLPVNTMKIDQSFVRDMLQDPDDLTIVEGVIGLGAAFRHQIIAEGVESADHALMLMELGCNRVQGFGIAKPMPAHETLSWVQNFRPDPRWLENAELSLSRDDFQLVLAEVNHRHWLVSLQKWMRLASDKRGPSPPLDVHECSFGHWYYGEGEARYGHLPAFHIAEIQHDQIHHLALELVQQTETGNVAMSRETEAKLMASAEIFRDTLVKLRTSVKHTDVCQ